MCALDGFHVEVESPRRGRPNSGISGVGERASLSTAETGDIVLIATEGLFFGGSGYVRLSIKMT